MADLQKTHLTISQDMKKQNKSILKITKALKKADRLLGSVSINSFSLNIYSEKVNSLVLELENSYLFLPQDIDDDLEPRYVKAFVIFNMLLFCFFLSLMVCCR